MCTLYLDTHFVVAILNLVWDDPMQQLSHNVQVTESDDNADDAVSSAAK